jgi:hypothetical protein
MKQGMSWSDVCIRNMSSRGLLLQGQSPPRPGSYVEVRRGSHIIVARVVWTKDQEFGARAQDLLPIEQIVRGPERTASGVGRADQDPTERPTAARQGFELSHEASRHFSSLMQYGFMVVVSLSVAGAAVSAVRTALEAPLTIVAANL